MVISSEFLIVSSYFVTEIGRSCQGNNTRLSSKINIPDLLSVQTCPILHLPCLSPTRVNNQISGFVPNNRATSLNWRETRLFSPSSYTYTNTN